ncbi:hypothetical protein ASPZODRAFT_71360 [Penicilliopsis zonata CBS 506.65]|uniref:DUF3835 domain-containing protein n=1 Tax=Penicilliopsis zonata CBS 506.65 TaxID=1073090 RepID=A0A1L9SBQ8_9EURO|nr:hypothetical protein ASPZODRAFT_71360 [Penicilliopsis zonata CBS 506.65]OJJ44527.1 hypothetical protein ASPZODRAFT_71360 [Penicilliopsis zonata CBS 506.65]
MNLSDGSIDALERRRLELEVNIRELQESLYHWRTWEAEYDGLKEEIDTLSDDATADDFLSAGRDFGGSLVNEKEVFALLGEKKGVIRSRQQVVDIISRRIDYVRQNVATMEKRLQSAGDELDALDEGSIARLASTDMEKDFPVTEIMEELDEEGHVISSSVSTPGDKAPELLDVLKKAGVKDIPDLPGKENAKSELIEDGVEQEDKEVESGHSGFDERENQEQRPASQANGVSETQPEITATQNVDGELNGTAVVDIDESPEDAKLRREMLQYGLNEVGAVVAELELDEDGSEFSVDDDYEYDDYVSEEDEEEDEYGRTTGRVLSDEYHQQMRALENKLNARGMWNVGKDAGVLPNDVRQELEEPHVVKVEQTTENSPEEVLREKPKKKVTFSNELDIAPNTKLSAPEKKDKSVPVRQSDVPVLSDAIVERTERVSESSGHSDDKAPPKKVSRFKSARQTVPPATQEVATSSTDSSVSSNPKTSTFRSSLHQEDDSSLPSSLPIFPARPKEPKPFSQPIRDIIPDTIPSGSEIRPPEGKTLADTLVERDVKQGSAVAPEPDELDEKLHRQQIATEFYDMRNRMIYRNGGFVNDDEPETQPIEEPPKRMSKFKAARVR